MSDLITSPLGDYRVEGPLGQTVIGAMYRGSHIHLGTPVTLVVVDERYASGSGFKTRLIQHAQRVVGFAHPNVIKTFLCGEHTGLHYIVTEQVEGGALKALPGSPDWTTAHWRAVEFVQQAAQGLGAAVVRGLIHGDLKLSNLLLTKPDISSAQVKLSELGLRQLAGESPISSDVAGLGGVLYEAITGRPASQASRGEFPLGTPEELKTVVRRCVSDDTRMQFQSCDELAQLLRRLIDDSRAATPDPVRRAPTASMPLAEPAARAPIANPIPDAWPNTGVGLQTSAKPPDPPKLRWSPPTHPDPLPHGDLVPCLHVFDESHAPVAKQFVRGKAITIGRDPDNSIVLPHLDISGKHARVEWDGRQRISITDLTSKNGTKYKNERLLAEVPQDWGEEQWVKIGPYWLCLQRPAKGGDVRDEGIEVILDPQSRKLELTPGRTAQCRLTLVNRKVTVEQIALSVQGVPAEWVQVQGDKQPQVLAYERAEVTLAITVPRTSSAKAGEYSVTIVARPIRSGDASGSATAQWIVLPFEDIALSMSPSRSSGLRQARYNLTLHHRGNFTANYVLSGTDDERQLEYLFTADDFVDHRKLELKGLEPGSKNVKLKVQAPKRWFGSSKGYGFALQAAATEPAKESAATEGQFQHRAIFPIWMIAVAPLLLLALLFALPSMFRPEVRSVYIEPINPLTDQQVDIVWEASRAGRIRVLVNDIPQKPEPDADATRYVFQKGFPRDARVRVLASNLFGEASKEITVTPAQRPPEKVEAAVIEVFTVTPQAITDPNQQVTIRWRASKATRVELTPIGSVEAEGTTTHTPGAEQAYTLTAFNKEEKPTTKTVNVRFREPVPGVADLSLEIISPSRKDKNGVTVVRVEREPVVFRWTATNAKMLRIEGRGSAAPLQGTSGEKSALLLGVGTYEFRLVASTPQGDVPSKTVRVQATCSRNWFKEATTLSLAGCKKPPQVQWQN